MTARYSTAEPSSTTRPTNPSIAAERSSDTALDDAHLVLDRLEESIENNPRALALKPSRFGSHNNQGWRCRRWSVRGGRMPLLAVSSGW